MASILAQAADHGTRILADSWLCTAAYETIRIMIFYITKDTSADMALDISTDTLSEVLPLINSNMKVLQLMKPLFATAGRCVSTFRPNSLRPIDSNPISMYLLVAS